MAESFVMRKEWLSSIEGLPREQQDKILADIVRYGTDSDLLYGDDPFIAAFVNMVKGSIDFSKEKYNQKVEAGKSSGGRKKKLDDDEILRLARGGMNSAQIAEELGISKSAVDHSDGWKNRKKKSPETGAGGFQF